MIQYKKGETLYAFNFAKESIRKEKAVIFCEGYMDVIAYHQAGITNAVAPLGTALTEQQGWLLRKHAEQIILGSILGVHASQAHDAFKSLSIEEKQKIAAQYEQAMDDAVKEGKTVITARISMIIQP